MFVQNRNIVRLIFILFLIGFALSVYAQSPEQERLEKRQKNQLLSFFLKDPKDAKVPTATMGVDLFNQAVKYYQNNEFDLARQTIKDSLAQDDTNPLAYELLGDINNMQQELDEAKMNYQIAYNLNSSDRIRGKIEKLSKEKQVDKKLKTYKEEHFIIKYNNQEQSMEGFALRELLRKTYRQISQDFAYYFKHKVVVLLYDEQDFKNITNAPHWVGGLYDGKVRMPIKKIGFSDLDLKALTTHEVTHAFVAFMSAKRAPAWINEGLAEYEESKIRKPNMRLFKQAARTHTLFTLHELTAHDGPMAIKDRDRVSLFYQQSYHVMKYLVNRYKMYRIKEILTEYGKGSNSDEAIRNVLKISIDKLEKEWLESI